MMRRYRRFLWLLLVPLVGAGAVASGYLQVPWDQQASTNAPEQAISSTTDNEPKSREPGKPATKTTGAVEDGKNSVASVTTKSPPTASKPDQSDKASTISGAERPLHAIDVARISAEGTSVIAGYAKPSSKITVLADGTPVGVATSDASGDWVLITPHRFASLDPKLTLKSGDHAVRQAARIEPASSTESSPRAPSGAEAPSSAAEVTNQMMQRLARLTKEAERKNANMIASATRSNAAVTARTNRNATEPSVTVSQSRSAEAPNSSAVSVVQSETLKPDPRSGSKQIGATNENGAVVSEGPKETTVTASLPQGDAATRSTDVGRMEEKPSRQAASIARADHSAKTGLAAVAEKPVVTGAQNTADEKGLPVPVQFVYREDQFTTQGEKAAELLLKYFKAKRYTSVTLSGHADERGSQNANMELSRARLVRIRRFLRDGGFAGQLTLVPKGETEIYTGIDRTKFAAEELYQLDRRVEVMSAR